MPAPLVAWQLARRARRLYPLAMLAYERWRALPPEERERHIARARSYAERGRRAVDERVARRRGRPR